MLLGKCYLVTNAMFTAIVVKMQITVTKRRVVEDL